MICYDRSGLTSEEKARAKQLEELYGFPFPSEIFMFWRWHQGLTAEEKSAFGDVLGMGLVGPFDVLAGRFDGFDCAYPLVLHWRFKYDPPEFVTVISGDTDGLHWGLWFDDHKRLPPVVAGYYANDSFDLELYGDTLFATVRSWIESCRTGIRENIEYDPDSKDAYIADLKSLAQLEKTLPGGEKRTPRPRTIPTEEGMGIVEPVSGGKAATKKLLRGKAMWIDDPRSAGPVLKDAYTMAGRPVLAAIVKAHTESPVLPRVSLLDYPKGSFHSLKAALSKPNEVTMLEIVNQELKELPDLTTLLNLKKLSLYGNKLTDLPASLGACQKLEEVNLFRNPMTKVPEVLFKLPALKVVILGKEVPDEEKEGLRKALPDAEVR